MYAGAEVERWAAIGLEAASTTYGSRVATSCEVCVYQLWIGDPHIASMLSVSCSLILFARVACM